MFLLLLLLLLLLRCSTVRCSPPPPVPTDCTSEPFEGRSEEADQGGGAGEGGLQLTCSLSAINSAREQTNFSVGPSSHTFGLTVRCLDAEAPGRLEPGGFASLVHLRKLWLDGCHLRELPERAFWGLDKLTSLKVSRKMTLD